MEPKNQVQEKRNQKLNEYKDELNKKSLVGIAGMFSLPGLAALFSDGRDYYLANQVERAMALEDVGAKNFDPLLRKNYIYDGPYSLITNQALNKVNTYVPPGQTGFVPADLTKAGKFKEILESIKKDNPETRRQITVSPGPQPARFSYTGLTQEDLGEKGQKGYIWANPDQPQFGYAVGNYSRGTFKTGNPAINLLAVDMPGEQERPFRTTKEIVNDDTFVADRGWGQRKFDSGDVMFPKENILGRAEVTAADVYTKMKDLGLSPEVGDFMRDPGKAFKELTDSYAEAIKTDPVTALQELATPVTPLGITKRETGKLPTYEQFLLENATPGAISRSGIGTVYLNDNKTLSKLPENQRLFLETADKDRWNITRHFEVNPLLVDPKNKTVDFLRRQSGVGAMTGLGLVMDPQINQSLQKGNYGEAAIAGGTSLTAGVAGEAIVKRGLAELAKRGVTAPLKIAGAAAAPVAAISLATTAERNRPMTKPQIQLDRKQNPARYGAQGPSANPQLLKAEAARRRGGKWKFPTPFGNLTIPELGISEAGGLFFR